VGEERRLLSVGYPQNNRIEKRLNAFKNFAGQFLWLPLVYFNRSIISALTRE
jgi:hypothetical protein